MNKYLLLITAVLISCCSKHREIAQSESTAVESHVVDGEGELLSAIDEMIEEVEAPLQLKKRAKRAERLWNADGSPHTPDRAEDFDDRPEEEIRREGIQDGQQWAKELIEKNTLLMSCSRRWSREYIRYATWLKQNYKITLVSTGGCCVTIREVAFDYGFRKIMDAEIERKYGHGFFEKSFKQFKNAKTKVDALK